MARGDRWFVERCQGKAGYVPVGNQPSVGFASPAEAIDWLISCGAIRRRIDRESGQPFLEGWGGPYGYHVRCVKGIGPGPRLDALPAAAARLGKRLGEIARRVGTELRR